MRRAVFLDRDGVLNEALVRNGLPYPPPDLASLRITEDAGAALSKLKASGFLLLVVTNQPDIGRGQTTEAQVSAMNAHLQSHLPLDQFFVCPHDSSAGCACRKPRPGLLLAGAEMYNVDLGRSYMIGDRWRDVDAGYAAGCRTIWIDCEYRERAPDSKPDAVVRSLTEAVDWILMNEGPGF